MGSLYANHQKKVWSEFVRSNTCRILTILKLEVGRGGVFNGAAFHFLGHIRYELKSALDREFVDCPALSVC